MVQFSDLVICVVSLTEIVNVEIILSNSSSLRKSLFVLLGVMSCRCDIQKWTRLSTKHQCDYLHYSWRSNSVQLAPEETKDITIVLLLVALANTFFEFPP